MHGLIGSDRRWFIAPAGNFGGSYYAIFDGGPVKVLPDQVVSASGSYDLPTFTCTACRPDWYHSASSTCVRCPLPLQSTPSGATNVSQCTCAAGAYYAGASGCTSCPAGTYKATIGDQDVSSCLPCPTGQGSVEGSSSCSCAPGHVVVNASVSNTCTPVVVCTPGQRLAADNQSCEACPVDTYSSSNNTESSCLACPVGSWTNGKTGQRSSSSCVCRPGFLRVGSSSSCTRTFV